MNFDFIFKPPVFQRNFREHMFVKLTAFNVATVLIELGKSQPESLQNRVGNIGWCQCGKCLGFFRIMITFSDLTSISRILIFLQFVGCFCYYKIFFDMYLIFDFLSQFSYITNFLNLNLFQKVLHLTNYAHIYTRRICQRCRRIQTAMLVEACPQECVSQLSQNSRRPTRENSQ